MVRGVHRPQRGPQAIVNLFAGAFCYADDIVLLAPCLRVMLNIFCSYASTHGLKFNPEKSQLIGFRLRHTHPCSSTIKFHDTTLPYSNEVTHLGHVLSYNLDDTPDIVRAVCQFHSLHISVSNLAWFCSLYASALSSSSDLVRIVYFDGC